MKIAIVWEQVEWGGVDSYLDYLLDSWPKKNDKFVIFHNKENKGAERLKKITTKYSQISFREIKTSFHFSVSLGFFSKLKKFMIYIFTPFLFLFSARKYKKIFQKEKFDILLAQNGGYPGSYGVISSIFGAAKAGIKVKTLVVHHAAIKPNLLHGWFRILLERKISSLLTSVITVSNATKETIIRNTRIFDSQNCHVAVIENGTPIPKERKKENLKPHSKVKIGILGRLELYKGHDDFLCALSLLPKESLNKITVDFIGGYSDADFYRLSEQIKILSLEKIVNIVGYIDKPISKIIRQLDLLAMVTKTFEGFGLTVIEALHQGIPVLATRVGIIPEAYPTGGDLIVDVGDIKAMSKAIEMFVISNDRYSFIPEDTRNNLWRYDSKHMAQRYYQHLYFEFIKA